MNMVYFFHWQGINFIKMQWYVTHNLIMFGQTMHLNNANDVFVNKQKVWVAKCVARSISPHIHVEAH
jgi:hypothetical protein